MTSTKKAGKSSIIKNTTENDDLPEPGTPLISPCCKLPRENINEVVSPLVTKGSESLLSPALKTSTSTTKAEAETGKGQILKSEDKLITPMAKKSSIKVIEKLTGDIASQEVVSQKIDPVKKKEHPIEDIVADNNALPMNLTPPVVPTTSKRIPVIEQSSVNYNPTNVAVPRRGSSRPAPADLDERPLILAIHLVPSLPIAIFEIIAEVIEATTGKAVVLLYEPRVDRSVGKQLVDMAFLPANQDWDEGSLLPVSFIFEHRLNKERRPDVFVDVVVARDCAHNIEEILDLRGYRCALPDRRKALGSAGLLYSHLSSKGENPSFFGNTLDSGSHLAALQMVAGKQAEVGVLESPVINCHRNTLPGINSIYVLASLGPLPPYRIMIDKKFQASFRDKIKEGLLNVDRDEFWMERLKSFGITGFAEYTEDCYDLGDSKSVVTSVPYY